MKIPPNFLQIIILHASDVTCVIVLKLCDCMLMCLCVCLLPLSWPNGQTDVLEFWHGGQVEGYLGQVCKSMS